MSNLKYPILKTEQVSMTTLIDFEGYIILNLLWIFASAIISWYVSAKLVHFVSASKVESAPPSDLIKKS